MGVGSRFAPRKTTCEVLLFSDKDPNFVGIPKRVTLAA